jgi:uncharacterized protein YidB (DUF937 family)
MGGKGSGGHNRIWEARPLDPNTPLWERQPKETSKAFEAFSTYRDEGPSRSRRSVAEKLSKSEAMMSRWSSQWSWVRRANAWDDHLDAQKRDAATEEVRDMVARQTDASMLMQSLGLDVLIDKFERAASGEDVDISTTEARQLVVSGARLERLNRGQPGEITETRSIDYSELTDEQLERLARGEHVDKVVPRG